MAYRLGLDTGGTYTDAVLLDQQDQVVARAKALTTHEALQAAQALIHAITGKPVSCGWRLSSALDAPRRALTALLNARLIPPISALLDASRQMLTDWHIEAPLMVVKGDGSLIQAEVAVEAPVETILSGPAASVVGAQFLTGCQAMLVADMGGTTTCQVVQRPAPLRLQQRSPWCQ